MSTLLALLTPIALLNSVAKLPGGLAGVVTSLATPKPFLTASAFILGKFVPFFVVGLLIAIGLDAAFDQTRNWAREIWQDPTGFVVVLQLAIGATMVIAGYRFSRASHYQNQSKSEAPMTPFGAFSVGAGMTLIGLPGALFYFAAIDQILRAELAVPGIVKAVLFYNLVFFLATHPGRVIPFAVQGACRSVVQGYCSVLRQMGNTPGFLWPARSRRLAGRGRNWLVRRFSAPSELSSLALMHSWTKIRS